MRKTPISARVSLFALLPVIALCGCGGTTIQTTMVPVVPTGVLLHGSITAGQQPVSGATVTLYAASTSGYKANSANILSQSITTATDGTFSTAEYTCVAGQQLYLVSSGGKVNGTSNASAASMAAIGDCATITTSTFVAMNEVTTVGSVYALAQFMGSSSAVGTSSTNKLGLANAFALVNNLVNVATGVAAGTTLPTGATAPTSKINTLADVLYACNGSVGGSGCSALFQLATPAGGSAPTNSVDALLAIAHNPSLSTTQLYNTATSSPFTPRLNSAPPDWTMSINYTGGGLDSPSALAIDSTGSVWAANYQSVATKLSPMGEPAAPGGFASAGLYESYGIAIDNQDNAWITNQQGSGGASGSITKFSTSGQVLSGTGFTAGGINFPEAIAADSSGNMWIADYGRTGATLLAPDGTSLSGASGFSSANLLYPDAVAVDSSKNGWLATIGAVNSITPAGVVTPYSCCSDAPSGVAIDQGDNVWLTDYLASSLLELNANGTILQQLTSVGGLYYPQAVAIDGNGAVWVVNFQGNSISAFTAGPVSVALSPTAGYGTDADLQQPSGLAVDASGNLWVANSAADTLTELVGVAAPVRTPLSGPAAKP